MWVWGTKMAGPFPIEVGQLKKLQTLQLHAPYSCTLDCGYSKAGDGVWGPMGGKPYESFEAGLADCVSKYGWKTTA